MYQTNSSVVDSSNTSHVPPRRVRAASRLLPRLLSLALVVTVADAAASAPDAPTQDSDAETRLRSFVELDSDNDGALSEQEVVAGSSGVSFRAIDDDGDGKVNRTEFSRYLIRLSRR